MSIEKYESHAKQRAKERLGIIMTPILRNYILHKIRSGESRILRKGLDGVEKHSVLMYKTELIVVYIRKLEKILTIYKSEKYMSTREISSSRFTSNTFKDLLKNL